MEQEALKNYIDLAIAGDSDAMEVVLVEVQDLVFNLSLRMLGAISDAEDATQDILIRIMTRLSTFQGNAAFSTWVYRIATNYLIDYKKSMFAKHPLDFDFYSNDIKLGFVEDTEEIMLGVSKEELGEELKMSCTNVMLQCLDPQTRCIFILGTMFKVDSKIASEILGITPENYRQKLSRSRKKMQDFLSYHCGLSGTGFCCCEKRVPYAIQQHRLNPNKREYYELKALDKDILLNCKETMEKIDDLTLVFDELPHYKSSMETKAFLEKLIHSKEIHKIKSY